MDSTEARRKITVAWPKKQGWGDADRNKIHRGSQKLANGKGRPLLSPSSLRDSSNITYL